MFIDEATIDVKAGDGGNGCVAFRREKFVPRGGPSGGDGGRGGDVVIHSSQQHNTLVHFRFRPEHKAQRGRHGEGSNRSGKSGEAEVLQVPAGTIVYDAETGEKLFDFDAHDQEFVAARAGDVADAATLSLRPRRTRRHATPNPDRRARRAAFAWS